MILSDMSTLIVVDMQNDFMTGGSLYVPGSEHIISKVNKYIDVFNQRNQSMIVFTRDWHPDNHSSFKEYGGQWPKHCVQGSHGAQFVQGLSMPERAILVSKGMNQAQEEYSGIRTNHLIDRMTYVGYDLYVCGVATDYCVKATVLDAVRLGVANSVTLLVDAIAGVGHDSTNVAMSEMIDAGVRCIKIDNIENANKISN